jgi:energy-coupling factor transporter ATP-binding protein EcfA2
MKSVNECKSYLEDRYRQLVGNLDFYFTDTLDINSDKPAWRFVDKNDLTRQTDDDENCAGLLLDPVVGILLYILPYNNEDITAQIVQALALRSRLLPELNYSGEDTSKADRHGVWRVVLYWLAEKSKQAWLSNIAEIKKETAYLDEISVDIIVNEHLGWRKTFETHGFPRLLFNTRIILLKTNIDDVYQWLSADAQVKEALSGFDLEFQDPQHHKLALEVVKQLDHYQYTRNNGSQKQNIRQLFSLLIYNFRNIENLMLKFESDPVNSLVLYGPNGTGKSTIFEALSLALFQVSKRYNTFLEDKDIQGRNRSSVYINSYLSPLGGRSKQLPKVVINEKQCEIKPIADLSAAKKIEREINGTLLSQEISQEFAQMRANELGAMVLKGYSELAAKIDTYVDDNYERANETRKNLLREIGLNASITRIDTAQERIAKKLIEGNLPAFPRALVLWLEFSANIQLDGYNEHKMLSHRWRTWGDAPAKDNMAKNILTCATAADWKGILETWLRQYNSLVEETSVVWAHIQTDNLLALKKKADKLIDPLKLWGEWLSGQDNRKLDFTKDISALNKQLNLLGEDQKEIVDKGQQLKARIEHISQISDFLISWSKHHPDECPTCGTNLRERDGLMLVVEKLKKDTETARSQAITEYKEITERIKGVQTQLAGLGFEKCPVSAEIQAELVQTLQWLIPEKHIFANYIRDKNNREKLIQKIESLKNLPEKPEKIDPEIEAEKVSTIIAKEFAKAQSVFEEPDNWQVIKKSLSQKLGEIVNNHLPETLGKLWDELSMNITPAPWLMPEKAKFQVKTSRGEQSLSIKLGVNEKAPLARYILNQAEIHILGLAWFFTRYLTHGRFRDAFIIMDDPAQEMDQTTFRDLCRLWETFMRLHKVYKKPLTLLIMLHQEERALDAARATGGIVNVLGWSKDQHLGTLSKVKVLGRGFHPLHPEVVLSQK